MYDNVLLLAEVAPAGSDAAIGSYIKIFIAEDTNDSARLSDFDVAGSQSSSERRGSAQ
jgi:hypothetical protein